MDLEDVQIEDGIVVKLALETFSQTKLDFVDTLLYAYYTLKGTRIFTFDKKLLSKMKKIE